MIVLTPATCLSATPFPVVSLRATSGPSSVVPPTAAALCFPISKIRAQRLELIPTFALAQHDTFTASAFPSVTNDFGPPELITRHDGATALSRHPADRTLDF